MNIIEYLRGNKSATSANLAKQRLLQLQIHERIRKRRKELNLGELQKELIEVILKYLPINENEVTVELGRDENRSISILELNVVLPEDIEDI